jgi:hypothetical protein
MAASIYRRITQKRRAFLAYSQLFLAPDHMMLVRSDRFEERYQRFYFKDIQALVVSGVPARSWMRAAFGVVSAAIVLLAATTIRVPAWRALTALVGFVPAAIALVDYLRGERCQVIVKTAVSNEPLPPVSRMRVATTVIAQLKSAVEQMQQGEWTAEMVSASGPPVMAPKSSILPPADRLLLAVFGLITINAAVFLIARWTNKNQILWALANSIFTEIVLSITTLRRRGDDPRWILFSLAGVVAVCASIDVLSGIGLFGSLLTSLADQRQGNTPPFDRFFDSPSAQILLYWGFGWRAVVAGTAWAAWFTTRRQPELPQTASNVEGGPASQP